MSLTRLTINNIVLITQLSIPFSSGLSTLTGETGAGKSILLDALGLALGARSDAKLLRTGTDKATVTALFEPPTDHPVYDILAAEDIPIAPGDPLILKRSLTPDGRSRARINDEPVSVKLLQNLAASLVEIHGQFDTHGLLNSSTHGALLDAYAGLDNALSQVWRTYQTTQSALDTLRANLTRTAEQESYLRDSITQLDSLAPIPGEEAALQQQKDSLLNREQVMTALSAAHHLLHNDMDALFTATGQIDKVADTLPEGGQALIDALDRTQCELEEARSAIEGLSSRLEMDSGNLEDIDERLYQLRKEARKHGCTVDELMTVRETMAEELTRIETAQDDVSAHIAAMEKAKAAYICAAGHVRTQRTQAATALDARMAEELAPLKMGKARFTTMITPRPEESWNASGMDDIQFLVSTNPGQAPGPLNKIASGGEMSRFMLALKAALVSQTQTPKTLIFDEVDAGIGGGTADAVGRRLARLAHTHQVLVVTHAPQVAAKATHHYHIEKHTEAGATQTRITPLIDTGAREDEIARMLAGESITQEARAAAQSLMHTA